MTTGTSGSAEAPPNSEHGQQGPQQGCPNSQLNALGTLVAGFEHMAGSAMATAGHQCLRGVAGQYCYVGHRCLTRLARRHNIPSLPCRAAGASGMCHPVTLDQAGRAACQEAMELDLHQATGAGHL